MSVLTIFDKGVWCVMVKRMHSYLSDIASNPIPCEDGLLPTADISDKWVLW